MAKWFYEFLVVFYFLFTVSSQDRSRFREHSRRIYGYSQASRMSHVVPNAPSSGWEGWTSWSACSRTCGGGVRVQRRNCRVHNRHENLTANWRCSGSNKKYQSCSLISCPDGSTNSRRAICAVYNNRLFAGNTYIWEPMSQGGPCELSCRARGQRFFVRHTTRVTDGADCSYSVQGNRRMPRAGRVKHICIEGRCMQVGCDGTVGSGLTMDECGVCGGDGQSCHHEKGLFRRHNLNNDFHVVVLIPAGSTRINVTESRNTRSYIALRSAGPEGAFYINGQLKRGIPDPTKSYSVAGTFFEYERPYQSTKGETMFARGPTSEDLEVLLYYQGANPGIMYEYTVPKIRPSVGQATSEFPGLMNGRHGLLDRSRDSRGDLRRPGPLVRPGQNYGSTVPQGGHSRLISPIGSRFYHQPHRNNDFQYRVPSHEYPLRNEIPSVDGNRNPPSERVNGLYPNHWGHANTETEPAVRPYDPDEESSNTRREAIQVDRQQPQAVGKTAWRSRGFGPCSKSCAEGITTTIVQCVQVANNQEVDRSYCTGQRPRIKTRKCNRQSCPPYYDIGKWSECSRSCGMGRRTRTVFCKQHFPGNFTATVTHRRCRSLPRPNTHEKCSVQECAHWEVDREWSKCNVQCGAGTQVRRAVCKAGNGETLSDNRCSSARRPSNIRACDAGPCVTRWYVTDWEECSADCDRGVQRRHVYCLNTAGLMAGCTSRFEPNSTRTCARSSCGVKYEWFTGSWGSCSSKCGNGMQSRKVTCLSVTPDGLMSVVDSGDETSLCDQSEKPASQQQCNTQSCGSRWYYTPWSECSVSCGGGSRTRDIQCLDSEGSYSSLCSIDERPIEAERCNTVNCLALRNPNCEDRLSRCQAVLQARLCAYSFYRTMCCFTCSLPRLSVRSTRLR